MSDGNLISFYKVVIANMNIIIRKERPEDYWETEHMTLRAFWNIHGPGCNEHLLVRKIRASEDYLPELSRVAEADGKIVGAIYYTKAKVVDGDKVHDIITFGPLAMEPTLQNTGIGRMLQKGDEPKVGEDVLFRWKTKEEAEITQICKNLL